MAGFHAPDQCGGSAWPVQGGQRALLVCMRLTPLVSIKVDFAYYFILKGWLCSRLLIWAFFGGTVRPAAWGAKTLTSRSLDRREGQSPLEKGTGPCRS